MVSREVASCLSSLALWLKRLYMLLWKNVHIRWRTSSVGWSHRLVGRVPIFLLIEIFWPVVLYVIMAILRLQFPPVQIPDSFYQPVALPSAGTLPFVQSILCDLDRGTVDSSPVLPTYPNASVNEVYSLLDEFGSLNGTLDTFCSTIHALTEQATCVNSTTSLGLPECQQDVVPLTCYLGDPDGFEQFLTSDLQFSPRITQGILGANISIPEALSDLRATRSKRQIPSFLLAPLLQSLFGSVGSFTSISSQDLRIIACTGNGTLLQDFITFDNDVTSRQVSDAVCALNSTQLDSLADELQTQVFNTCDPVSAVGMSNLLSLQDLQDIVQTYSDLSIGSLGNFSSVGEDDGLGLDASTRFFCGEQASAGSANSSSSQFQELLRRILFGDTFQQGSFSAEGGNFSIPPDRVSVKILYSPQTPRTQSIIARASRVFRTIRYFQDTAEQVRNCSQFFLDNYPPGGAQVEQTQRLIEVLRMNESSLTTVIPASTLALVNSDPTYLNTAQQLLNQSAPNNIWDTMATIRDVSSGVFQVLSLFDWDIFFPVPSEDALVSLATDYVRQTELNITTVIGGVVFEGVEDEDTPLSNATIKIRMNFTFVMDTTVKRLLVWTPGPETATINRRYILGTFIFIQDLIERAMAEEVLGERIPTPGVYLQQMPYPCYVQDFFVVSMEFLLPLAMIFAWLFPVAMTVRAIVSEKETRLKEYIKMVGVSDTQIRLSRLIVSGTILLVSVCFITMLLKVGNILPFTDWSILFLYLCLYALVMLGYSFLVSTIFNNANLAACVASLLYFMVLFAHSVIITHQQELSPFVLGLCCLWAPLAFALGAQYMVQWEVQQVGLNWSNIALRPVEEDPLSFLNVAGILMVDTILYFLVTWYIEGVYPGRYGVAKPFYFPFMPSYWFGESCHGNRPEKITQDHEMHTISIGEGTVPRQGGPVCEDDPAGLPLGIAMENLSKTYQNCLRRKKVTAVKNLSLNFFEGQITALLGHNGAGKTTALSILAGLFEPTSGTARIYGNSIRRHMDQIRQGLGICPQHNILLSELTVEEHLLFFGQLKGLSRKESAAQIPEWLSKVDLLPHATKLAKHLSGGMKRKLSILLAFVGGSRTIILDEPTAGVDPFARRQIWDFLLRQRDGRTIILSTHHMDEAEILGDRIAILSHGSLICCGSFEFIKHRFGRGHTLTLVTASQSCGGGEGVETVTEFLEGFVKSVKLEEVRGRELHYLLPLSGARANVLTQLFAELERSKERLGVVSYGLTACSMEEIFVELTEKEEAAGVREDGTVPRPSLRSTGSQRSEPPLEETTCTVDEVFVNSEQPAGSAETDAGPAETDAGPAETDAAQTSSLGHSELGERLRLFPLWWSQFVAITVKRFHYTKRRFLALVIQNVLPLFLIFISLLVAYLLQNVADPPPLDLTPDHFFEVNPNNYLFVGGNRTAETDSYYFTLIQRCGVGGSHTVDEARDCFEGNDFFYRYQVGQTFSCFIDYPEKVLQQCTCVNGTGQEVCVDPVQFPLESHPLCFNGTGTGTRVQDLREPPLQFNPSYANEALTTYLLRSKNSFIQQRYGGVSFGHERSEVNSALDENVPEDGPFLATRQSAKVWYSLKGYHAVPSYLNAMNNALMRANLPEDARRMQYKYGFRTVSHPLPTTQLTKQLYAISQQQSFLVNPLAAMFSLGFVVAGFVLLTIEERSGNVKHLQQVCGMNKAVYWLANTVWDLVWYVGFVLLTLVLYLAFQDPFYTDSDVLPLFLLILLCYGLAVTPWVYALSFLFQSPATAYIMLFCINFLGGFIILMVDAVLLLAGANLENFSLDGTLNYWLLIFPVPSYSLGRSMLYLASDYPLTEVSASLFLSSPVDPYTALVPFLVSQLAQCVLYTAIVVVIETWPTTRRWFRCLRKCRQPNLPQPYDNDSAVVEERSKVRRGVDDEYIVWMDGLSKIYRSDVLGHRKVVVNQLSLRVRQGECFGLLGVNGAGKTTTFKMLTGDIRPSAGDALIAGHRLSESKGPAQQSVGYCPQVDALIDQLTGRQHLTLFCRLRGLRGRDVRAVVEWALLKLGLSQYADRTVGAYSGGNRRKLSTAISLLANPPLILLDEPTAGVDPRARHFIWSIVRGLVSGGQSVVLTTHSMAECEALCSRVAIMVNGEFHCLGSPQQLKSTYGHGYRLKVRMAGQVEPVKEFIRQNFPGSVLKEEHYMTLVYQVPTSESLLLHNVFESMEQARQTLDIQDYSVSQTTLDDVFIHFANEQSEEVGLMGRTRPSTTDKGIPLESSVSTYSLPKSAELNT